MKKSQLKQVSQKIKYGLKTLDQHPQREKQEINTRETIDDKREKKIQ